MRLSSFCFSFALKGSGVSALLKEMPLAKPVRDGLGEEKLSVGAFRPVLWHTAQHLRRLRQEDDWLPFLLATLLWHLAAVWVADATG